MVLSEAMRWSYNSQWVLGFTSRTHIKSVIPIKCLASEITCFGVCARCISSQITNLLYLSLWVTGDLIFCKLQAGLVYSQAGLSSRNSGTYFLWDKKLSFWDFMTSMPNKLFRYQIFSMKLVWGKYILEVHMALLPIQIHWNLAE